MTITFLLATLTVHFTPLIIVIPEEDITQIFVLSLVKLHIINASDLSRIVRIDRSVIYLQVQLLYLGELSSGLFATPLESLLLSPVDI